MASDKLPAMPFYPGDWFKDQSVAMCATVTRAIWVDLILSMWTNDRCGQVTGTVVQLAKLARCSEAEMVAALADLDDTKTADVTNCHGKFTVTNRRMRREYQTRKDAAKRKAKSRGVVAPEPKAESGHKNVTTPLSSSVSISVSTAVEKPPSPPKGEPPPQLPPSIRTPAMISAVESWIAYKAERREGYKPQGLKALYARIANVAGMHGAQTVIDRMERAKASGWKGWDHDDKPAGRGSPSMFDASDPRGTFAAAASYLNSGGET